MFPHEMIAGEEESAVRVLATVRTAKQSTLRVAGYET